MIRAPRVQMKTRETYWQAWRSGESDCLPMWPRSFYFGWEPYLGWAYLLLVLILALRVFSRYSGFLPSTKTNISKFTSLVTLLNQYETKLERSQNQNINRFQKIIMRHGNPSLRSSSLMWGYWSQHFFWCRIFFKLLRNGRAARRRWNGRTEGRRRRKTKKKRLVVCC